MDRNKRFVSRRALTFLEKKRGGKEANDEKRGETSEGHDII